MATDKCIQVIPLCGNLLVFHRKRANPKGSEIAFWRMAFSQDLGGFFNKDCRISSMYKNTSREVDIVCCTTALDIKARQKVPCVLLRLCKRASQCFKYMLYSLDGSTNGKLHVEFALPYEVGDNISVLRGPTLVWSHENRVFYTSSEVGGVREVAIPLTVSFVGELPLRQRQIGILGSEIEPREDMYEVNKGNENLLYFLEDGRTFSGKCLLPDAYQSIIKCMVVVSAEEAEGSLRSTVLAATSRKQLVRFKHGLPEDVCSLPYEQPQSIRILHGGDGGCIIAIVFNHGNVCAVWKDSFKVAACWTGVSSLLVDDFIGCGSEQMLLLFEDPAEEILGNFLLTDLSGVHYSCGREEDKDLHRSDPAQENVLLTVKALDSRLQSGLAFLQELQRDLSVKERVLQQSVTALADLVSDREHVPPPPQQLLSDEPLVVFHCVQEGLVCMWDEDEEEEEGCVLDKRMQTESGHRPPKVKRFWHRVVGESLVFGVLLTANTDALEERVSGSVLLEPSGDVPAGVVVQSRSKCLQYPELPSLTSLDLDPPSAKRSRRPPDGPETHSSSQLALLTVTDLTPLLSCSRVTCSVLLHCLSSESGPTVHQCGRVSLDMKDVLHGGLEPRLLTDCSVESDESREDLLCLLAAFESWRFRIESSEHTLADVSGWLVDRLGAKPVGVSPQYLLIGSTQPSSTMLIHWQPNGSFQALLHVHCSGQFAVFRFLHSLCDFLPASHHISPLRSPASWEGGQGPASFMEREVRMIKEGVASLFRDEQEMEVQEFGGESWKTPASPERLLRCREEWQRERERCSQALRPLVDTSQYHRLLHSLIQTQLDGDIAALVEAQSGEG